MKKNAEVWDKKWGKKNRSRGKKCTSLTQKENEKEDIITFFCWLRNHF